MRVPTSPIVPLGDVTFGNSPYTGELVKVTESDVTKRHSTLREGAR